MGTKHIAIVVATAIATAVTLVQGGEDTGHIWMPKKQRTEYWKIPEMPEKDKDEAKLQVEEDEDSIGKLSDQDQNSLNHADENPVQYRSNADYYRNPTRPTPTQRHSPSPAAQYYRSGPSARYYNAPPGYYPPGYNRYPPSIQDDSRFRHRSGADKWVYPDKRNRESGQDDRIKVK